MPDHPKAKEGVTHRSKRLAKLVGRSEFDRNQRLIDKMNPTPWDDEGLSREEQFESFMRIATDPVALGQLHEVYRQRDHIPTHRVSKRLRMELQAGMRKFKSEFEAQRGDYEPPPLHEDIQDTMPDLSVPLPGEPPIEEILAKPAPGQAPIGPPAPFDDEVPQGAIGTAGPGLGVNGGAPVV